MSQQMAGVKYQGQLRAEGGRSGRQEASCGIDESCEMGPVRDKKLNLSLGEGCMLGNGPWSYPNM